MNVSNLLREALKDTEYLLNQYDEIIRRQDFVEVARVENNLLLMNNRCSKREQLYLSALLAKEKERYSAKIGSQNRVANKKNT